ncbi:MAG: repeat-containing glycosyl hydrolase, partial [Acidobacteria bacterium]|nr:repeat-containing glycosyl hydrolase [Acidobacteriota bacterium]
GTGSGVHKTTDGGRTWTKLSGGLPTGPQGRIGLDLYQRNPDILYAVTENLATRPPTAAEIERAKERGAEARERSIGGEIYRTGDGGRTWRKMNAAEDDVSSKAGYSFNQIRVDQNDDRRIIVNSDSLISSTDGGKTLQGLDWSRRGLFSSAFGDFRTMWIDPEDSSRMIMGSDGGVHVSYDGGKTADHYYNLPGGEIYAIDVDMDDPYHIYAGLQDHDSWRGPINGPHGRVGPEDWVTVGDNDGMYNRVDPTDSRWVYNSFQWGGQYRADQKTHTRARIVPSRAAGQPPLRFNWTPPILLSPHNPAIVYTGAQVLFRSLDRGEHWQEISPDLTTNDPEKISPPGMTVQFCTLTTLSESPLQAGVIWAGADDGKVQVTANHGADWTDVTANLAAAGAPAHYWTTRVLASRFAPGTAYVTKSGRRYDEMKTVVMRTTDFGKTWTSVAGDLPDRSLDVVVEDLKDGQILFAGTDKGVFATLDGGRHWVALKGNMPTVPVTDMVIHPREHDLVVATYGRGLFVTNVAWMAEARQGALDEDAHLFAIRPRAVPGEGAWGNFELYGDRHLIVPNDDGVNVDFYLKAKPPGKVKVTFADATGAVVRAIESEGRAGLNRVSWDVTAERRRRLGPGEYSVTVQAGGRTLTGKARVLPPGHPRG